MAYNITTWVDNQAPFLDAANLNKIENGINTNAFDIAVNKGIISGITHGEDYRGTFTPSGALEYPANPQSGFSWYITGVGLGGYLFTGGDLNGKTTKDMDKLIYNGTSWSLVSSNNQLLIDDTSVATDKVWSSDKVNNLVNNKVSKSGDTMTGTLNIGGTSTGIVLDGVNYKTLEIKRSGVRRGVVGCTSLVDNYFYINATEKLVLDGTEISVSDKNITDLKLCVNPNDATNKAYVDGRTPPNGGITGAAGVTKFPDGTSIYRGRSNANTPSVNVFFGVGTFIDVPYCSAITSDTGNTYYVGLNSIALDKLTYSKYARADNASRSDAINIDIIAIGRWK